MLDFPNLDLSPFDRFGLTPLDDAIRHEHLMVQRPGGEGVLLKKNKNEDCR